MTQAGERVASRYHLERLLGGGGTGDVYLATDAALGREVAIKLLRAEIAGRRHVRERFEREARVLARLRHPSAVAVLDYGEHAGRPFLVMERLSGPTLSALVGAGRPLALPRAARIGAELADVLAAAHALALVHRDVKPSNVILEPQHADGERAILLDFGLAFVLLDDERLGRVTSHGQVAGTPHYMAPEQVRDVDVGPPADVYSLGCLLHELVTGEPPFDAPTQIEVMTKQLYLAAPSARARRPDLDLWLPLDQLLLEMLAKTPSLRPPAEEVRTRLLEAAATGEARGGGSRAERMVAAAPAPPVCAAATGDDVVGYVGGQPPSALVAALAANGVILVEDATSAAVLLAPDAAPERVTALAADGTPVIAAALRGDLPRIIALLKAGAAEVADFPLEPADVTAKIVRALRRKARAPRGET